MTVAGYEPFLAFIRGLPMADSPLESLRGWLLRPIRGSRCSTRSPTAWRFPSTRTARSGSGARRLGRVHDRGETKTYRRGDTYYVPDSVAHSAVISPGYVGIDVFADANRYAAREGS